MREQMTIVMNGRKTVYQKLSRGMGFPTMWYVQTSKASGQPAHTRILIRAFASLLNILLVLSY